jgi:hypothetical protein
MGREERRHIAAFLAGREARGGLQTESQANLSAQMHSPTQSPTEPQPV